MIFVHYAKNDARDCYCMYNSDTGYVTEMQDIKWLHHMQYSKPEATDEIIVYPQLALLFEPNDAEAREGVTLNASEPIVESKDNKEEWSNVRMRLGRVVKPPVLDMKEFGTNDMESVLSTIHQNYYAQL